MKAKLMLAVAAAAGISLMSCQDEVSNMGSSLASGEVTIVVDSVVTSLETSTVYYDSFDARTTTKLIGRLNVPEYGSLSCSFVTQLMSSAKMNIPDSIPVEDVDSMRLVLSVPRGALTGDSLAPQQLRVYRLEKQLPSDISSTFNPDGYYSANSLMGEKSYTLSNIAKGDSAVKNESYVRIPVTMPLDFARDIFTRYREDDEMFQWPASFNEYFPGIYVEQNFGNGCVANVTLAQAYTYWHRINRTNDLQEDFTYQYVDHIVRDSICLLASQPEVLSSNVINYKVSDYIKGLVEGGNRVITTPGGYMVNIKFPAQDLLDEYHRTGTSLSTVSSLHFEIPASTIKNDHGIGVAPYLLMVRESERESFFADNKVPDGITSFYASYNSTTGCYRFDAMREYFLKLLEDEANGEVIDNDDLVFSLVPVSVTTETATVGYNQTAEYVTRCAPYLTRPTMTQLHTDRAVICFTFSLQELR